jgi:hypothetical protein
VFEHCLAVGAGLLDRAADRIITVCFVAVMRKEKCYQVARSDLIRRRGEPESALCSALGMNETAPTQQLKNLRGLSLGDSNSLSYMMGLK